MSFILLDGAVAMSFQKKMTHVGGRQISFSIIEKLGKLFTFA